MCETIISVPDPMFESTLPQPSNAPVAFTTTDALDLLTPLPDSNPLDPENDPLYDIMMETFEDMTFDIFEDTTNDSTADRTEFR